MPVVIHLAARPFFLLRRGRFCARSRRAPVDLVAWQFPFASSPARGRVRRCDGPPTGPVASALFSQTASRRLCAKSLPIRVPKHQWYFPKPIALVRRRDVSSAPLQDVVRPSPPNSWPHLFSDAACHAALLSQKVPPLTWRFALFVQAMIRFGRHCCRQK